MAAAAGEAAAGEAAAGEAAADLGGLKSEAAASAVDPTVALVLRALEEHFGGVNESRDGAREWHLSACGERVVLRAPLEGEEAVGRAAPFAPIEGAGAEALERIHQVIESIVKASRPIC